MPQVTIGADDLAQAGLTPAEGDRFMFRFAQVAVGETRVTSTDTWTVTLDEAGNASTSVPQTPPGNAVVVSSSLRGFRTTYVAGYPNTDTTLTELLTDFTVNPSTLAPTPATDAWWVALRTLQAQVDAIEGGGPGGPGDKGPTGDKGPDGDRGPQGFPGDKGPVGDQGPIGTKGATGDLGTKGATGDAGPVGDKGPIGGRGPVGDAGTKGATGDKGPAGDKGPTGDQGPTGAAGTITAAAITDSTVIGRTLITASTAAAVKAAAGLGSVTNIAVTLLGPSDPVPGGTPPGLIARG
ncbi:collagen-like protein [Leifsonia poae]|uniref:collagen-like protein n=1 Tax=Leifsonia poae TaxID=110933 RepID=UPI001CBE8C2E|nr:collagen-like protein [Leifsonia poae]